MAHNGTPRRFQGFFPSHPPSCAGIWARTLQTRGVQAPVRQPSTVVNSRGDQFVTGKLELEESLRFGAKVRRFVDIAGRHTARSWRGLFLVFAAQMVKIPGMGVPKKYGDDLV